MVLTALRTELTPAVVVPDEQTWTLSGTDPASKGLRPVFATGEARAVLVPERVPGPLADALRSLLEELATDAEMHTLALPYPEQPDAGHHDHHEHAGHGESHPMDHHDMGGDHHDMMAIVGEPSRDGLVMEPIELDFGPLGTPLPGGLTVSVTLDGDVVTESSVRALLGPLEPPHPPDALAPVAWTVAVESAGEPASAASPWCRLAAVECERAVSHLAWLRAFARILGWRLLSDGCTHALEGLPRVARDLIRADDRFPQQDRSAASAAIENASRRAESVLMLAGRSRLLRLRTAGVGSLDAEHAERAGLRGPVARASGVRDDARSGQPLYERLGFEPVIRSGGDAHARTLVRAEEALRSLRLARAALGEASNGSSAGDIAEPSGAVEGPRGPLHVEHGPGSWRADAPGSQAALRSAGEAMVGLEWAASLVALASFDLSPWRVGT